MTKRFPNWITGIALSLASLSLWGCGGDQKGCDIGQANCWCNSNGSCNSGAICASNGVCAACTTGDLGCACHPNATCNGTAQCQLGMCFTSAPASGVTGVAPANPTSGATTVPPVTGTPISGSPQTSPIVGTGTPTTPTTPSVVGSSTPAAPTANAPKILNSGTNAPTINRKQQLIITALVTDPDGIKDVIGGVATDPATGSMYGALVSSGDEGAYSLTLGWDAINLVNPISSPTGPLKRTFRLTFSDIAGHQSTADVTVSLACDEDSKLGVCGGECTDIQTDRLHCGSCDNACNAVKSSGDCVSGKCIYGIAESAPMSCSAMCARYSLKPGPTEVNLCDDGAIALGCASYDYPCSEKEFPLANAAAVPPTTQAPPTGYESVCDLSSVFCRCVP